MMDTARIELALGSAIEYVAGTVNGVETVFEQEGDVWFATVPRNPRAWYDVRLTMIDAAGNRGSYEGRTYYGIYLVTDRTRNDVDFAQRQRQRINEYGWESLTAAEQAQWLEGLKGAYNLEDLHRVDAACDYLAQLLSRHGYHIVAVKQDWRREDIPTKTQLAVYLGNVERLRQAFVVMPGREPLPEDLERLDWQKANTIERVLLDIYILLNNMIAAMDRYAGTFYCGEEGAGS